MEDQRLSALFVYCMCNIFNDSFKSSGCTVPSDGIILGNELGML